MKKFLVLLMIMAIAMGSVFAAEGQWGGGAIPEDGSAAATLEVTLKLDGEDMFNIGFASEEVTAETINSDAFAPLETLALELDGKEYQGKAYVYYGIKSLSTNKYDISLSIDGPLKATNDQDGIAWGISSEGESVATSASSEAKIIFPEVSSNNNEFTVVSKQLVLSTTDFENEEGLDTANQYSANVTLKIATHV